MQISRFGVRGTFFCSLGIQISVTGFQNVRFCNLLRINYHVRGAGYKVFVLKHVNFNVLSAGHEVLVSGTCKTQGLRHESLVPGYKVLVPRYQIV